MYKLTYLLDILLIDCYVDVSFEFHLQTNLPHRFPTALPQQLTYTSNFQSHTHTWKTQFFV
eukprot:m.305497 g.305497  ORF g.305497 m.305497 type:complete len:61 (+) comp15907_c0_seq12:2345-2527(+)